MALAGRRLGAPRSRCSFIGDEACCPQPPCALRVAAAWAYLGARRSSAMKEHRLRRVSADLGPCRSQRVPLRVLPRAARPDKTPGEISGLVIEKEEGNVITDSIERSVDQSRRPDK